MSEVINFLRKTNADQATIDKLIQILHEQNPEVKGDPKQVFVAYTSHVKKRTTTTSTGQLDKTLSNTKRRDTQPFYRKPPLPVKSYPLTHTTIGTPIFPSDDTRFGGRVDFDGSTDYINIADQTIIDLERTDAFSIIFWIKTTITGSSMWVVSKGFIAGGGVGYGFWLDATADKLFFELDGTPNASNLLRVHTTNSLNDGLWHHVAITYSGNSLPSGIKIYFDGISETLITDFNALNTSILNNQPLVIAARDGGTLKFDGSMAWVSLIKKEVTSAWITDHKNGLLDTSDGNDEILTIPFVGDENPKPDATSGLCQSQ